MNTSIQNAYKLCSDYLDGSDRFSPHFIIEFAEKALSDQPYFSELWDRCVFHLNNWSDNTISEQLEEAFHIIEDLCGELGAYLDGTDSHVEDFMEMYQSELESCNYDPDRMLGLLMEFY
ncbi:MAG: hypothetical protein MJZ11_10665 [Lachnospiraceae bacterium]|nr:hypothetical protein [Lachnospiraceae bacterium]